MSCPPCNNNCDQGRTCPARSPMEQPVCRHVLFRIGDTDAPDSIKDRNGEVVLAMCRRCGKAESELTDAHTKEARDGQ